MAASGAVGGRRFSWPGILARMSRRCAARRIWRQALPARRSTTRKRISPRTARPYHVIMDTVGTAPFSRCQASLRDGGRFIAGAGGLADMLHAPWAADQRQAGDCWAGFGARRKICPAGRAGGDGAFKAVIDRRYRFEQMVEAHRYVDSGRRREMWW